MSQFYKSNDFHSQYISITNRSEGSNSLISFQNLEQEGVLSLDFYGYNRQNFRLNHDIKISDKFRVSSSNLVSTSEGIEPNLGAGSPFYTLLFTPPHANLLEKNSEDGSEYNWNAQSEANWPTTETNPLYTLNNLNLARNRERFVSNLKLSYQITDYLEFETYYSIDYENSRFSQFVDTDWLDEENSTFLNGFIFQTRLNSRADNISATLAFDKYVNDNLNLKVKVNYFHENRNTSSINAALPSTAPPSILPCPSICFVVE